MIEATEMLKKMGKRKFIQFASQPPKGQTIGDLHKRRRWGTNVRFKKCEHGIWVIDNYKPYFCDKCVEVSTKPPDFHPHFNAGLGCYVESKSDMKKAAKAKGLIHIGSDYLR